MTKCKLCPCKKTCRDECYGENPCEFAKAFDHIEQKIESLRSDHDELERRIFLMKKYVKQLEEQNFAMKW